MWVDVTRGKTAGSFATRRLIWRHFAPWMRRHGLDQLTDRDGSPVRLHLMRLRKSWKSAQYLRVGGVIADFASGHTAEVAAGHYADIGAHRDIHEQAVEDGLRQAMAVAQPPVVIDEYGARLDDGEQELPSAQVQAALSGSSDVFLASCRDFFDTPFAAKGKPCPVAAWGCLDCANAVFTTRHLPQVLAFLAFIDAQREEYTEAECGLRYGRAFERIVTGIRGRFTPAQIATAQAIAEGGGAAAAAASVHRRSRVTGAAAVPDPAAPLPGDAWVLPEAACRSAGSRGPRFSGDVWDFRDVFPRTVASARIDFTKITSPVLRLAVREFLYSRLHRVAPVRRSVGAQRPIKPTGLHREYTDARMWVTALENLGVTRLADARQHHLDAIAARWAGMLLPSSLTVRIGLIQAMAAHGPYLSADRLTFMPWQGRAPAQIARHQYPEENATPRIPEPVMAPLLEAALFYVQIASADLHAAREELSRLRAARATASRLASGEARRRVEAFIELRRQQGRGIPALPAKMARFCPGAPVAGGIVLAPNAGLVELLCGTGSASHLRGLLEAAGAELGYEEGGLETAMSAWPRTGRPWRPRPDPASLPAELSYLRTASWLTIAYLSGMRDTEVRELGRDCTFTTTGADGRTRYKLGGRVFKGRRLTGDEAEWVVLEPVHQAVAVLRQLNDDPGHLFGYSHGSRDYLTSGITTRLAAFRDHVSELFAEDGQPFIPHDGDQPWVFNSRQFRRSLAWHIAHQPFGVIAGAQQYHHAKLVMFEGYAGTSASGFAAEVAAEENIVTLDYLEDLYRDWDGGARSSGGAAARIDAEFARIRGDLEDLPGIIADPPRLRAMPAHLAKTLHPGILNDCFFNPATAACAKAAGHARQPLPMLSSCLRCPNARRTTVHLPRLAAAREQALELQAACEAAGPVPAPQRAAITGYITDLTQLIDQIHGTQASHEEETR